MSFDWQRSPSQAFGDLAQEYAQLIHDTVLVICNRFVPIIEAWLKENAPWTDRTGNARQSLFADVDQIARSAIIVILGHGVEYGEWLEFAHGSMYAVIAPALDYFAPILWSAIRRELGLQ